MPRCLSTMRFEHRPHVVGDDARAFGGRMNAVALVQAIDAGDALQQERHERDVDTCCASAGYTLWNATM